MTDASTRGRSNRLKGQRGERELANELSDLLGITLKRRVRNHANESDITGLPGFSVEVKNCAVLSVAAWWKQTVAQCDLTKECPALFYKIPRKGFRAVLPMVCLVDGNVTDDLTFTVEMSVPAFAMFYREHHCG